jgi:hypothetical protein
MPAKFDTDEMICKALRAHADLLRAKRDSGDFQVAPPHMVLKFTEEINRITKYLALSRKERALALLSELLG